VVLKIGAIILLVVSLTWFVTGSGAFFGVDQHAGREAFLAGVVPGGGYMVVSLFALVACFGTPIRAARRPVLTVIAWAVAPLIVLLTGLATIAVWGAIRYIGPDTGGDPTTGSAAPSANSQTGSGRDNGSNQDVFPLSFSAYDNSYSISSFSVGTSEDGDTTVEASGSGFGVLPMRDGRFMVPVSCAIIVDGVEIEWSTATTSSDGIEWEFDSTGTPDLVVFYPTDNESNRTEMPVN
jgi:hypothetical protein